MMYKSLPSRCPVGVCLLCAGVVGVWTPGAWAQTAITDWSLLVSDGRDSSADGIAYQNKAYAINRFSTATAVYGLGPTASSVYIRRNTDSSGNDVSNQSGVDNNNRSSVWEAQFDNEGRLMGSYEKIWPAFS